MFPDGSIGGRRFGAGLECLFLKACMVFWSAGAGASSLHRMRKAALKFPASSFAQTAAAMCWPSLFDVRRFSAVGVVTRDSLGLSLLQPVTRLLMMLLRSLQAPPRFGFVRMTGANKRNSFHGDLLLGDLLILSRMFVRRCRQEAIAARGMRFILINHGG